MFPSCPDKMEGDLGNGAKGPLGVGLSENLSSRTAQRRPERDPFWASAIWGRDQSGSCTEKWRPFLGQCDQPAFARRRCTVERGAFTVSAISVKEHPSRCSCNACAT